MLDETASALDAEAELLVPEVLARLAKGRTTLIVAHRFSTIRQAHRIVVMPRSQIMEMGAPQELLLRGGHFTRLANLPGFLGAG